MRTRLARLAIAATAGLFAGCADRTSTVAEPAERSPRSSMPSVAATPNTTQASRSSTNAPANGRRITLTISETQLIATLNRTPASDDLLAQLPLTLSMSDHGSVEKIGKLPAALSTRGVPAGADPAVGDLGYYAPWNNLVLYYGDQSYNDGIVRLGTIHGDPAAVRRISGEFTLRIEHTAPK